ncbi:MAG: peptidoglycan-binding domain-containing protein [Candidatus Omnitrophica bacterium]|nr:peptidoglycan-binding domain-containing protein [Candidatus Omnitrophota bacterium]
MGRRLLVCGVLCFLVLVAGCATSKKGNLSGQEQNLSSANATGIDATVPAGPAGAESQNISTESKATEMPNVSPTKNAGALTKKDIQTALKNAGFYNGLIDGKMGHHTRKAIREFQKANGLKADGVAGKKTKSLLAKYLSK